MPWRESLLQLKEELNNARVTRLQRLEAFDRQVAEERAELLARHESLSISVLLSEMNDVLLNGQGEVETTVEWETGEDEDLIDLDDDSADVISTVLAWNEGEELEIVVDLVMLDEVFRCWSTASRFARTAMPLSAHCSTPFESSWSCEFCLHHGWIVPKISPQVLSL